MTDTPTPPVQERLSDSARIQLQSALRLATKDGSDLVSVPLSVAEIKAILDIVQSRPSDEDMANVGRALMDTIDANINDPWLKGWAPAQCPSEIVGDLLNKLDELQSRRSDDATGSRKSAPQPAREAVEVAKRVVKTLNPSSGSFMFGKIIPATEVDLIAHALLSSPSREEVIEECANVADEREDEARVEQRGLMYGELYGAQCVEAAASDIAARIRALKSKPSSSE